MSTEGAYNIKDIKALMLRSYKLYKSGAITEAQAYRENTMLANILKAIESSEIEERLAALERTMKASAE